MKAATTPGRVALLDVALRLAAGGMTPEQASAWVESVYREQALPDLAAVCAEAESRAWYAPRDAHALARLARALAETADPAPAEIARVDLAEGVTLNALERFAEARPLLQRAAQAFAVSSDAPHESRALAELAIACTYLDDQAAAALERAQAYLAAADDALARAYVARAEGIYLLEQGHHDEAAAQLRQAGEGFIACHRHGEAALCWWWLALARRFSAVDEALGWLDKAAAVPAPDASRVHQARCDYGRALLYQEMDRYAESLVLLDGAGRLAEGAGQAFLAASCHQSRGIGLYHLDEYAPALAAYERAQTAFAALGAGRYVTLTQFNVAAVLYMLNRYADALATYAAIAEDAQARGNRLRQARCQMNMALCHGQLGRYDQALDLYHRAWQGTVEIGAMPLAAQCEMNLAGALSRLGRHDEALGHYDQARQAFSQLKMPIRGAHCELRLAELYLAVDRADAALVCLTRARTMCAEAGLSIYVAMCDRERARVMLARAASSVNNASDVCEVWLAGARAVFAEAGLLVDVALCDLALGEAYLQQGQPLASEAAFAAALAVLSPGIPDEAWRAHHGLGRCALAQGDRERALKEWLTAIETLTGLRASLATERISGAFFTDRQTAYEAALALALALDDAEAALVVSEAAKSQTFRSLGYPQTWRRSAHDDPYLASLLEREATLRRDFDRQRRALSLVSADDTGLALRDASDLLMDQSPALARLRDIANAYEETLELLRLAQPTRQGAATRLFALAELRESAARLGRPWACLTYLLVDSVLTVFYLDADRLVAARHTLTPYDAAIVRQCTDVGRNYRTLIYGGQIGGRPAPGLIGPAYRQHLYRLLVPPAIADALQAAALGPDGRLFISPHGALHTLPFGALLDGETVLGEQAALVYTPSLAALAWLLGQPTPAAGRALVCGLADFQGQARPLPHVVAEVGRVRAALGDGTDVLWGEQASRARLLALSESGALAEYEILHFATHAIVSRLAPSMSRILLADASLTFADILALRLRARLVVLSTCESLLGETQAGDEIMSLALAFLWAGAQAVVASLWPVEDEATSRLMAAFYRHYAAGVVAAQALQRAQHELRAAGASAYDWAGFVVIGAP